MMAYEGSESTQDNFGKFIYQFQPETKTFIRKLERILIKLYTQNLSLLFNETCLNELLLLNYSHIYGGCPSYPMMTFAFCNSSMNTAQALRQSLE